MEAAHREVVVLEAASGPRVAREPRPGLAGPSAAAVLPEGPRPSPEKEAASQIPRE